MDLKVVLALIAVGGCAWMIIRFVLWREDKYLSTEEQIQEMMDETSIPSETLWSMFDKLN
nr:MAG TPA: hypothetical protein [Caudoviricetes sp.]